MGSRWPLCARRVPVSPGHGQSPGEQRGLAEVAGLIRRCGALWTALSATLSLGEGEQGTGWPQGTAEGGPRRARQPGTWGGLLPEVPSHSRAAAGRRVPPHACPWFQERPREHAHAGGHRPVLLHRLAALGAHHRAGVLAVHRGQVGERRPWAGPGSLRGGGVGFRVSPEKGCSAATRV